jgi:PKD repeat protein
VESGAAAYDEGDPAVLTLRATNLTTAPAVLVVTTTAESLSQQVVFTDVRTLDLPAATQVGEDVVWDTSWVPNGTYAIHAEGDGGLSSQMLYVSVSNVPPTVDAGPDQTADEGAEVVFDGSFSDPGLLDTHTVAWDFGDSATAGGTLTPTHAFADDGLYTVTLTVTDDDGGVGSDTLVVSVNNLPPTVDAGPDQTADEGDEVAFAGSFSDPGLLDTHTVAWDFGDSETAGGTLTPTHTYGDDGLYTVTLTVTDDDGGEDSSTLLVTVSNVAPLVNAGPDQTADEGDEVVFSGSFTDPGTADTHSVAWDFGDGITTTGTLTPTHAYADDGVYTATLTVTDDGGGEDSSTLLVTVSNVAPVVSAGPNRTVDEGDALTLVGSFSDPGTADTHTVAWSLGDGSSVSDQLTVTHVYTALGIYTATLTVTDDDGGVGTDEVRVTVREPVTGTPSTDVGDYAILGLNSVWMQWDSDLHSGHVGVQNASPGPVLDPDGTWVAMERIPGCRWGRWWHCWRWRFYKAEVSIGHGVTFHDPASAIGGDTVRLRQRADVFDVYCNEFKADPGATYGQVHTPLSLPLVTNLPALPEITPGSTDYVLGWQKSLELPSGAYGDIWLGGRSVLTLTGGVYHFANLQAGYESRIVVTAPTEVRIAGRLGTSMNVVVGPAPGSGLDASDLIVFVAGTDGCPGGRPCFFPKSATIGYQNRIAANIYAPNGTLWLMSRTEATGAFIGRNVQVGSSTQVWLKSGFADESPSP